MHAGILCKIFILDVSIHSDWDTHIASDIPTDHSLNGKCTRATISWYISTSNSGVVGGSGAAATA